MKSQDIPEVPDSAVAAAAPCSAKPSWFAAQGAPACSMWCKTEIEYCAWAYVKTLEILGDEWGPILSVAQIRETLESVGMERNGLMGCLLRMEEDHRFWEAVRGLTSAEKAFEVGGLAWTRRRFDMQNAREHPVARHSGPNADQTL